MSTINDGGPAFPLASPAATWNGQEFTESGESVPAHWSATPGISGVSIRDYFAAKALQGLCANPGAAFQANDQSGWGMVNCTVYALAQTCYAIADAMLVARSEQ
jgi:hypothetical protein